MASMSKLLQKKKGKPSDKDDKKKGNAMLSYIAKCKTAKG